MIPSPMHHAARSRGIAFLWLAVCLSLFAPARADAAFGLTSDTNFYTVDTGAGLVFKVRRTDNGSSTQSAGEIASLVYNGVEYQDTSRGSQVNSGFDFLYNGVSAVTASASVITTDYVKVTVQAGNLTHYYLARRGYPHIYMGTYFTTEPDTLNLVRYIVRIPSSLLPNGPTPSDIRNNTGAIEASDIFGLANGETRSKHYSNMRLIDWSYIGATGTNVGVWMVRDNQEGGSGGPFYRSLLNQCGSDQEITYIVNYGEAQTEAFRLGVFNGPYVLEFTNGSAPSPPIDTSWIYNSGIAAGLLGWVQDRGYVTGQATGIPAGFQGVVGFANSTAQYWCVVNNGSYTSPWMIPGTYTMTLYKGELAVATDTVTVPQSTTPVTKNIASTETTPPFRWRIGQWDGTPTELLNGDKVTTMHPSDVRMSAWGPVTYTIGSSASDSFPCYQWKSVNNPTMIKFDLSAGELTAHTLRIGLTCAHAGGRPQVNVNSWTSSIPSPSTQPDSRTLTVGTYRGNNVTYTYNIPASAFVAGTNTMTLYVVSGSSGTTFLSPGYSYDCVELDTSAISSPTLHAYLPFNETSGTTALDVTGNGWDGTLTNGPTWSTGQINNAVSLGGTNQYVSLPAGVVSGLNGFTIAAWVNLNTVDT
ncbi:MAG: polysaccharide lyase family protein, partial [Armatimonadota bacterium]|nr:polysaccharide lyase family protein [Armatimonadota bacterium]